MALTLMLAGILVPPAMYAYNLRHPTPAELLTAVCMSLFAGVVFLWILDATSILKFRAEWISRSVYGAAIASVLGTSVAVFSENFSGHKYPYEGSWEATIRVKGASVFVMRNSFIMSYSDTAKYYWGFSNLASPPKNDGGPVWAEIVRFEPSKHRIVISLRFPDGSDLLKEAVTATDSSNLVETEPGKDLEIVLTRPR